MPFISPLPVKSGGGGGGGGAIIRLHCCLSVCLSVIPSLVIFLENRFQIRRVALS